MTALHSDHELEQRNGSMMVFDLESDSETDSETDLETDLEGELAQWMGSGLVLKLEGEMAKR